MTDPAEELYQHRNDPDEWDDAAEDVRVAPKRSEVVSFRVPGELLDAIQHAAEDAGENLSGYIRSAVELRLNARVESVEASVSIGSSSATGMVVQRGIWVPDASAGNWEVPEFPPMTQQN